MGCPKCGYDRLHPNARYCPQCGERVYVMADTDYTELITERTQDFVGREWVFQAIDDWLADPQGSRVFLLSGDPGTGKSAVSARLVQMSVGEILADEYPHLAQGSITFCQFCQAFNDPTLDPLRFVRNLSLQLAERYPPFAEALTQTGDQQITINASQTVGMAEDGSEVKNVVIESLTIGSLSARVAFDRVVRQPLEQLCTAGFDGTILVLVDALDEALTYDQGENIVTLLGHATDHPRDLPPQLRFLLTSRPDDRVKDHVGQPTLDLIVNAPDDANDVAAYARRRLHAVDEPRRSQLADHIAEAGEGNFLFHHRRGRSVGPGALPAIGGRDVMLMDVEQALVVSSGKRRMRRCS